MILVFFMKLEDSFRNLTRGEFDLARDWYQGLRIHESGRILETLEQIDLLRKREVDRGYTDFGPLAVIVAGSSIDSRDYTDIDLFALPQSSCRIDTIDPKSKARFNQRGNPNTVFGVELSDRLPDHSFVVSNYDNERSVYLHILPEDLVRRGLGAIVTLSLFYEIDDFESRRPGKSDDLLLPKNNALGAEDLIEYNREHGSKFLVLNRQYEI